MTDPPPRRSGGPQPRVRPTEPSTLVVSGLATAALTWVVIGNLYSDLPPLPGAPAVLVAALAVIEVALARQTRARIERRPGALPVQPLQAVRYLALGKASALAGAIFVGFATGTLTFLLSHRPVPDAMLNDVWVMVPLLVASAALLAAGLLLERSCRVPARPDDEEHNE
jgi:hypothetical protein